MKKMGFSKAALILLALLFSIILSGANMKSSGKAYETFPESEYAAVQNANDNLPVVGTIENLKRIIEDMASNTNQTNILSTTDGGDISFGASQKSISNDAANVAKSDYSTTNIQVEGVDEGDLVKTDGKYIYQISQNRMIITRAQPPEAMELTAIVNMSDKYFTPSEIYVDENLLVLIGMSMDDPAIYDLPVSSGKRVTGIAPPSYVRRRYSVKAIVYDTSNKYDIKELRQVEIDGSLAASRKIGSKLYIVCNKHFNILTGNNDAESTLPYYRDSISSDKSRPIDLNSIKYFPDCWSLNYLVIGVIDVENNREMSVNAYLGSGEDIYMSQNSLYIAVTKYQKPDTLKDSNLQRILPSMNPNTLIYKFALNNDRTIFSGMASVPGRVLNQFSMDEYGGYFRAATTSTASYNEDKMSNNVYVMDSSMKVIGKLENIAPGEKIYSARFMGKRGYLVTFRTVDPLFAIDFSSPDNPKILGELKIPGYSNYLHPYDENHIIGFGKDTVEIPYKDNYGRITGSNAYYLGMKISLFDVTDVNNPKELFSEKIGDRGTDSEVLSNHKALLFSKDKSLLAFPVTVHTLDKGDQSINKAYNIPAYGSFAFQGAYVYDLDLTKGFTLKGRITHMDEGRNLGELEQNRVLYVNRILYIGNTLYTISDGKIIASNISNLKKYGEIHIPSDNE